MHYPAEHQRAAQSADRTIVHTATFKTQTHTHTDTHTHMMHAQSHVGGTNMHTRFFNHLTHTIKPNSINDICAPINLTLTGYKLDDMEGVINLAICYYHMSIESFGCSISSPCYNFPLTLSSTKSQIKCLQQLMLCCYLFDADILSLLRGRSELGQKSTPGIHRLDLRIKVPLQLQNRHDT